MAAAPVDLTKLLIRAASGDVAAAKAFYLGLLQAEVFGLLNAERQETSLQVGVSGETQQHWNFVRVREGQRALLPIFFSQQLASDWSEDRFAVSKRSFAQLIETVGEGEWMIINPGEDVGKELSPWEIQCLRQGPETVDELISELEYLPNLEVDVDRSSDLCPRFREQARTILDQYPEVTEAFLIQATTREEQETQRTLVGLHTADLTAVREQLLLEELQSLAHNSSEVSGRLTIVSDLNQRANPNVILFDGATPFYLVSEVSRASKEQGKARLNLLSRFGRYLQQKWRTKNTPDGE